jgi:hypothetical protein
MANAELQGVGRLWHGYIPTITLVNCPFLWRLVPDMICSGTRVFLAFSLPGQEKHGSVVPYKASEKFETGDSPSHFEANVMPTALANLCRIRRFAAFLTLHRMRGVRKCERRLRKLRRQTHNSGAFWSQFINESHRAHYVVIYPPSFEEMRRPLRLGINERPLRVNCR